MRPAPPPRRSFLAVLLLLVSGCASYPVPTLRESDEKIARLRPAIAESDKGIGAVGNKLVLAHDIALRIRREAFNKILTPIAKNRSDDARIIFNGNKPWIEEEKSLLGITYRNTLNIDGGSVDLNLTDLQFTSLEENRLSAHIEMQGKGTIAVSGKYAGIPASATPEIDLALADEVEFLVQPTDTGTIVLRPVEKKIPMRVRFSVKLIEWKIPWNEVIMLNTLDLIKPVLLPANIQGTIAFPTLAQDPKEKYGTVSRDIIVRDVNVMAAMQVLDWRCNIELRKGKK